MAQGLAHNGEINTVQGNCNEMRAVETAVLGGFSEEVRDIMKPIISDYESDSASLDRIVELLILSGFPPELAVNLCIPPVWEQGSCRQTEKRCSTSLTPHELMGRPSCCCVY